MQDTRLELKTGMVKEITESTCFMGMAVVMLLTALTAHLRMIAIIDQGDEPMKTPYKLLLSLATFGILYCLVPYFLVEQGVIPLPFNEAIMLKIIEHWSYVPFAYIAITWQWDIIMVVSLFASWLCYHLLGKIRPRRVKQDE